jgi:signal transduction histidine kinase
VSLRLRILLLVTAINVGVLLLVVQAGLAGGGGTAPVPDAAVVEALELAQKALQRGLPDQLEGRYTEYAVIISASGSGSEWIGPESSEDQMATQRGQLREMRARGRAGHTLDADGYSQLAEPGDGSWAAVHVGFNDRARREASAGVRRTFLFLAAGTVLLIAATYLILRNLVLRPLQLLEIASSEVAEGRPPPEVPVPRGGGEMARLLGNFNRMAKEVHEYQEHLEDRVLDTLQRVTATERRLVVAQRLAATGTLAAGFAHEINNPVGGILNAVRKLREGSLSPERTEEYFELVQDGVDRIRTIVERMLDFTPQQREPAPVDVAEACRRAVALATHRANEAGVEIALNLEEPLGGVVGDSQELTQALLNLVLNAIDALEAGKQGSVSVSAASLDGEIRVEVTDNGIGMDAETAERCVDLFFSTKPEGEGTGLGLGIVQHIVVDHGGTLEIDSEPHEGTTIRMRIPSGSDK